jgi:hypothetical protein
MSKIVQAANVMISRKNLITEVSSAGTETFFLYNKKYIWYYPHARSISDLMEIAEHGDWEDISMVGYKASELGTREAIETFHELYRTVKERLHGVDEVLDDIIKDDPF